MQALATQARVGRGARRDSPADRRRPRRQRRRDKDSDGRTAMTAIDRILLPRTGRPGHRLGAAAVRLAGRARRRPHGAGARRAPPQRRGRPLRRRRDRPRADADDAGRDRACNRGARCGRRARAARRCGTVSSVASRRRAGFRRSAARRAARPRTSRAVPHSNFGRIAGRLHPRARGYDHRRPDRRRGRAIAVLVWLAGVSRC